MGAAQAEVFLSYCWADSKIADEIYENLIQDGQINLHRDTLDIKKWEKYKGVYAVYPSNGLYDPVDFRSLFEVF